MDIHADTDVMNALGHNTSLHAASAVEETNLVSCHPDIEENTKVTQDNIKSDFDIARLSNVDYRNEIASFCPMTSQVRKLNPGEVLPSGKLVQIENKLELNNISRNYQKRSGTSGLSGQLYETKLLSLVLLRALRDNTIKDFVLATNIEGVGAFDDIVLKYETNNLQKNKVIFLQAKHKDDPSKDKLKVKDIFKQNGDFSLLKYFESYLKIKQKFITNNKNVFFMGSMEDVYCQFIIYSSAEEQFTKKRILEDSYKEKLIKTNNHGLAFQFLYDTQDVEILVLAVANFRITQLAKSLSKCIIKNNFDNVMNNDLIKVYHVYLAHNVITIETIKTAEGTQYCIGKFRESFWTSRDVNLSLIRRVMCNEIEQMKEWTSNNQRNELINILKSLTFTLPSTFGNHTFQIHGNAKKRHRRLAYLCSILHKLLSKSLNQNEKYILVKLDDDSVGPDEIIQRKDLEDYRLGGLVGNLLTNDGETEMLKFNLNEQSLSKDNIEILRSLKTKHDLTQIRFDISIHNFPKMTLNHKNFDRILVEDFLSKLIFYTNQAKEDEVENILKQEIDDYLNSQEKQLGPLLRVKCDALFSKVHEKIQKWWQLPHSAPYLTKSCKFYNQLAAEIIDSPLLNMINFIKCEKYKNTLVEFKWEAIEALKLDSFLQSEDKIKIIISNEINFSAKKVFQYFYKTEIEKNFIFLDLDSTAIKNYLEIVCSEIECTTVSVLVVITRGLNNAIYQILNRIISVFKGKLIILCPGDVQNKNLSFAFSNDNVIQDTTTNFNKLSGKLRKIIFEKRTIFFQGMEINVGSVLNYTALNIFSPNLLSKLINNKKLVIGDRISECFHNETINYYIGQSACRYITLNESLLKQKGFRPQSNTPDSYTYLIRNNLNTNILGKQKQDVILISKSENTVEETSKINKDINNIHWFTKNIHDNSIIWKQTDGSLQNLMQYIDRESHSDFMLQINTLKDIQNRIVLISAEPGMGKSTLLNHIVKNTKQLYPSLWILKINLIDCTDQYSDWKENKTNISLKNIMAFLYGFIKKDNKSEYFRNNILKRITINSNNEVGISHDHGDFLSEDLFEIKLLNHFYNNYNLAVLFDGFDEICPDYTNEVIHLLNILKTSKVAHLWVTSRQCNIFEKLESALGTFSFSLKPLTQTEQKLFLRNFWSHRLSISQKQNPICTTFIDNFYSKIKIVIRDVEEKFTSLPLHLHMIAEIYQHYFQEYIHVERKELPDERLNQITNTNLVMLYKKFMHIKFFNIRYGKKKKCLNPQDPDIRNMIAREQQKFVRDHRKLAADLLLDRRVIFSEYEMKLVHELKNNIKSGEEKTGIIECIVNDSPKFVHLTFAEYFAAEFVFNKIMSLDCTPSLCQYFVNRILTSNNQGIRRFINSKLQTENQNSVIHLMSNKNEILFDATLAQDLNLTATAIFVAVEEDLDYIALFVLDYAKAIINTNNLSIFIKYINKKCRSRFCVFCLAIAKRKSTLVQCILKLVTEVDFTKLKELFYCEDIDRFSPVSAVLFTDDNMSHIIFNCLLLDPKLMVELFILPHEHGIILTTAHCLGRNAHVIKKCRNYLLRLPLEERVKIFNVTDFEGQSPLHYAARENNYEFFAAVDDLLGREEFKKVCRTADTSGFTPICTLPWLPHNKYYYDKFTNILEKVFEVRAEDVKRFVCVDLPKLHPKKVFRIESGAHSAYFLH